MEFGQNKISWNWFIWFREVFLPGLFKIFLPTELVHFSKVILDWITGNFLILASLKYLWKQILELYMGKNFLLISLSSFLSQHRTEASLIPCLLATSALLFTSLASSTICSLNSVVYLSPTSWKISYQHELGYILNTLS